MVNLNNWLSPVTQTGHFKNKLFSEMQFIFEKKYLIHLILGCPRWFGTRNYGQCKVMLVILAKIIIIMILLHSKTCQIFI